MYDFQTIAFSALICLFPPFLALCHVCKSYYNNVPKEKIKLGKKFRILPCVENGDNALSKNN